MLKSVAVGSVKAAYTSRTTLGLEELHNGVDDDVIAAARYSFQRYARRCRLPIS